MKRLKLAWLSGRKSAAVHDVAARRRTALGLEVLEGRDVPAVLISGLDAATGAVTFTGDGSADALTLIRWETSPGSGTFVLRHNLTGGGLNSPIDLDPGTAGDQTLTLGTGSARNIGIDLGGGNDTLTIDDSWTFNHKVTFAGGAGTDGVVGNNNGNAWAITNVTAGAGTLGTGADNLSWSGTETLAGGVGVTDDTLTGENAARTWNLNSTQTYTDGTSTITFTEMDVLQGGSSGDTFNIRADTTVTALKGGGGNDVFAFHLSGGSPVTLTGTIDGEAGSDAIDYSGYGATSGVLVSLTGLGSTDGFTGTEVSIAGTFDNIDAITNAGGTADVLTGLDAVATWTLSATPNYASGGRTLALSGFEQLGGGSEADTFVVSVSRTGNLSGGSGADVFNLTGGTLTGDIAGDDGADDFNFSGGSITGAVTGDAGADTFNVTAAAAVSGGLGGGDDNDDFNVSAALTGSISGDAGNDTFDLSGAGSVSGDVAGGTGDDALTLAGTSSVAGTYAGGAGVDTLSFAGYASSASMTLTALGGIDGFDGTGPAVAGFSDVNVLIGSSNVDTLIGRDVAATWEVDGSNRYVSTAILGFSAIENLTGGSAVDTFDVTAAHTGSLTDTGGADDFNVSAALTGSIAAGAGNDAIDVSGTGSVSGGVDGGADNDTLTLSGTATVGSFAGGGGDDTLSYAAYSSARAVTLTGSDAGGYDGSEAAVGSFTDVDTLTGSGNTDTLTGRDAAATWGVDGTNTYTSSGLVLNFAAFENLNGGSGVDTFDVTAAHTGNLGGGGGADDFNVSAALTGSTSGDAGNDTFDLTGSGSVSGTLAGGADNDTFTLAGTSTAGGVAGGTGSDTLSYAGRTTAAGVFLTGTSADGYSGAANGLAGGFTSVDALVGSSNADTLTGMHVNSTWTIDSTLSYSDGANSVSFSSFETLTGASANDTFKVMNNTAFAGTVKGGVGTNTVDYSDDSNTSAIGVSVTGTNAGSVSGAFGFTAIANLKGGSGNDTFTFASSGARVTGTIDGQEGSNTLSYAAYTTGVRVSLAANSATGTAGITNFVNVTGGSGTDILIGNASSNVLNGGVGNDIITGGDGNDTITGGAGNDILIGGLGADTMDGGADDDILIGGITTYDTNLTALNGLMAEWGRSGISYSTRVGRISGTMTGGLNGSFRLTDAQVNDDAGAVDGITGGAGTDWFFSTDDTATDRDAGTETLTNVS